MSSISAVCVLIQVLPLHILSGSFVEEPVPPGEGMNTTAAAEGGGGQLHSQSQQWLLEMKDTHRPRVLQDACA